MHFVTPKVFNIASTYVNHGHVEGMLAELGADKWEIPEDSSDPEILAEVAGRLCYKSFQVGLNPNVTKVREDSKAYLQNILKQKHGSVVEHSYETFAILNVSRVFTHELVRHRLANFSQESLRYVRLTDLGAYYPKAFEHPSLSEHQRKDLEVLFKDAFEHSENTIAQMEKVLDIDNIHSFDLKKKYTSAMRRIAPNGLTTHIIITANYRMWRHMISKRSNSAAEEEIRGVFATIAEMLQNNNPFIFQDMTSVAGDYGIPEYSFEFEGV